MTSLMLSPSDRLCFRFFLPPVGDLQTLEIVQGILEKIFVSAEDKGSEERSFDFSDAEMQLLTKQASALNNAKQIPFEAFGLAKKLFEVLK